MTELTGGRDAQTGVVVSETVRLTIPASLEFVRIARLTASGIASRVGFDVDEIEDLRVAVDELSSILVDIPGGPSVELAFTSDDGGILIEGRREVEDGASPTVDELTQQILAAVVDEYAVENTAGETGFRCVKRLSS